MADARLIITAIDQATATLGKLEGGFLSLKSTIMSFAGGITAGLAVKEFIQASDAMTLMNARLKLVTGSIEEFNAAREASYQIAQTNNVGLEETARLYTKLAEPIKRLGGDTREITGIVEAFAASLRVGGASTQEASAATLQFAQAMASGRLNGDEFRSLAEASPRFMSALADGMGVPIERLKEMSKEGKLTADVVGNALLKSLAELKDEASRLPDTVGGAMQRMKNDALLFVEQINEATGATEQMADIIGTSSGLFREFGDAVGAASLELDAANQQFDLAGTVIAAIGTVVETLTVVFANVAYVAKTTATEIAVMWQQAKLYITGNFEEAKRIGDEWSRQAEANRRAIDKFSEGVVGATNRILQQRDALKNHSISSQENSNELARLSSRSGQASGEFKRLASSVRDSTDQQKAAKKAADEYAKAADEVLKLTSASLGVSGDYVTKLQALELWYSKNRDKTEEYRQAVVQLIMQQDSSKKMVKEQEEAEKALAKALEDTRTGMEKSGQAYRDTTAKIVEQSEKLELEALQLGLTKEAQAALTVEQRNNEIARLQALVTTDMVLLAGEEEVANINARIAALQRLNTAEGNLAAKGALVEAAKTTQTEWNKTAQTIESSLTDALMRGFESGKDFAKNLKDTLINLFKTLVLKPIIQPIAQTASATLLGVLGIPTNAAAAGGAGGAGNIGNLFSLGSSIAGLGSYAMTGLEFILGGGSLGTALSSAGSLIGGGMALEGLATGIGAAAPYLLPIIAGAFALSKLLGDKRSPAQQNFGFVNAAGADLSGEGFYSQVVKNGGVSSDYTSTLQTIAGSYRSIVEDLGGALNDQLRFGLFTSASPDGLGAQVVANVTPYSQPGGDLYTFNENGPNETMAARLAAQSPAMIAAALKATDFDDRVDAIFARLSATPTADELSAAIAEAKEIVSPAEEATIDTAETVSRLETLVQQSTDAQTTMITVLRDILANGETGNAVAGDGFTQLRDRLDTLLERVGSIESRVALAEAA